MMHTRVVVTGRTDRGSSRTIDAGAKFRDPDDIARVTAELKKQIGPFYPHVTVTTRESD